MENNHNLQLLKGYLSTAIIAVVLIITAVILAGAYKSRFNKQVTISVTGLAEKSFASDLIVWQANTRVSHPGYNHTINNNHL